MDPLNQTAIWHDLQQHAKKMQQTHMRDLFAQDAKRFQAFSAEGVGIFLDYSKNWITQETLQLLLQLAEERELANHIKELFTGGIVNFTENRPALHTALRLPEDSEAFMVDEQNIAQSILAAREKMRVFSEAVRQKKYVGYRGKAFTDIVHVGIGGSDLGPAMAYSALSEYVDSIQCHFISNHDHQALRQTLKPLDPETTLAIFVSKSFTTEETLANAEHVKNWFLKNAPSPEAVSRQMLAVTAVPEKANQFGITTDNIFPFWEWVGGRYSVWSAVSLSLAISIGMNRFNDFLAGAYAMDQHFEQTPFSKSLPVLLALLGIWYNNFFSAHTHVIIPYCQSLQLFPDFLQQLHMESLGKSVTNAGDAIDYATGTIIWGGVGTNSQHSFHQLLFQGTQLVPVDFLIPRTANKELIANCFAQSRTLMHGYLDEQIKKDLLAQHLAEEDITRLIAHKKIRGNNPSNTLLLPTVDPFTLGALIALYEHKVFVQGVIWNIDPFDQWGVERGKVLAKQVINDLNNNMLSTEYDSSTRGLIERVRLQKEGEINAK